MIWMKGLTDLKQTTKSSLISDVHSEKIKHSFYPSRSPHPGPIYINHKSGQDSLVPGQIGRIHQYLTQSCFCTVNRLSDSSEPVTYFPGCCMDDLMATSPKPGIVGPDSPASSPVSVRLNRACKIISLDDLSIFSSLIRARYT